MAKYLVNGKKFDTLNINTTRLCSFKFERLQEVFDLITIYVVNNPISGKRTFYREERDADDGRPIWTYEISEEEAHKYCIRYKAKENFEEMKSYGGNTVIRLGNKYKELTGFED